MSAQKINRWELVASTGSHFDSLDGMRGLAILLVVVFHTFYVNPAYGMFARLGGYFITAGWMGVPIFFVLSGFLISYPFFLKRTENPRFWYQRGYFWRRVGKILPPFYLSIVLFTAFYWWQFHDFAYLSAAWKWGVGLGNFLIISPSFNTVYWSLLVESHFYIVLPLLFWLTRGRSVRTTGCIIFLILCLVPLFTRQLSWPEGIYVLPGDDLDLYAEMNLKLTRFPCMLDYFAWGVMFAAVFASFAPDSMDKLRIFSVFGYAGVGLMVISLAFWGQWNQEHGINSKIARWSSEIGHLLPSLATFLMLFFVFDRRSLGARVFSLPWLRFIGIVSYEWFLFHLPIVTWFQQHSGPSHGSMFAYAWRTVVPLCVAFIFSVLVYRWFSLPILSWIRDRLNPFGAGQKSRA